MNAIIGYSRLLQRRLADRMDEREARNLANIETSAHNLLNLINDILDLSRIEAGRIEINVQSVDVRSLADECADALESLVKEGVELRREMVPSSCPSPTPAFQPKICRTSSKSSVRSNDRAGYNRRARDWGWPLPARRWSCSVGRSRRPVKSAWARHLP